MLAGGTPLNRANNTYPLYLHSDMAHNLRHPESSAKKCCDCHVVQGVGPISLHVKTSVYIPSALIGWNYVCTDIYILYLVYNYLCTHVAVKLACFDMQGDT